MSEKNDVIYVPIGIYSGIIKNEITQFATTWLELEDKMLHKVRQERDKYRMISHL